MMQTWMAKAWAEKDVMFGDVFESDQIVPEPRSNFTDFSTGLEFSAICNLKCLKQYRPTDHFL